jgi:hypothetical protein
LGNLTFSTLHLPINLASPKMTLLKIYSAKIIVNRHYPGQIDIVRAYLGYTSSTLPNLTQATDYRVQFPCFRKGLSQFIALIMLIEELLWMHYEIIK